MSRNGLPGLKEIAKLGKGSGFLTLDYKVGLFPAEEIPHGRDTYSFTASFVAKDRKGKFVCRAAYQKDETKRNLYNFDEAE